MCNSSNFFVFSYFVLYSSLSSYIPKLSSLLVPDYTPTAEDILHLRVPTTAVHEINFCCGPSKIRYGTLFRRPWKEPRMALKRHVLQSGRRRRSENVQEKVDPLFRGSFRGNVRRLHGGVWSGRQTKPIGGVFCCCFESIFLLTLLGETAIKHQQFAVC